MVVVVVVNKEFVIERLSASSTFVQKIRAESDLAHVVAVPDTGKEGQKANASPTRTLDLTRFHTAFVVILMGGILENKCPGKIPEYERMFRRRLVQTGASLHRHARRKGLVFLIHMALAG